MVGEIQETSHLLQAPAPQPSVVRKWATLWTFCFIFYINTVTVSSLFSQTQAVSFFYDTTAMNAELMQRIFFIEGVVLSLPAAYMVDCIGLQETIWSGCIIHLLGVWVRYVGRFPSHFQYVVIAQVMICAPFVLFLVSSVKLVVNWTPRNQHVTALAITFIPLFLGFLTSLCLLRFFQSHFASAFLVEAVSSTIATVMCVLLVRSFPKQLPSERAVANALPSTKVKDLVAEIWTLLQNVPYLANAVCFSLSASVFLSFITLAQFLLRPEIKMFDGYYCGIYLTAAVFGSFAIAGVADLVQKYKHVAIVAMSLGSVFFVGLAVSLSSGTMIVVSCAIFSTSFFLNGALPLLVRMATDEIALPRPNVEGAAMGLIVMCTFILANMQIGTIHGFHEKEWNRATTGVWLMLIAVGLSLGLVFAGYRFALKFEPPDEEELGGRTATYQALPQ